MNIVHLIFGVVAKDLLVSDSEECASDCSIISMVFFSYAKNLMTDFMVLSEIACLEDSPGRMRRTEVWIPRDEIVDFLE